MGRAREDNYATPDLANSAAVDSDNGNVEEVSLVPDSTVNQAVALSLRPANIPHAPSFKCQASGRKFDNTGDGIRDAWVEITRARTEDDFKQAWKRIEDEFPDQRAIIDYLKATYIPFREQFMEYAVCNYRNYGIKVTSWVESSHYELKSHLRNRFADLHQLQTYIKEMLLNRRQAYHTKFHHEMSLRRVTWDRHPVLWEIIAKVSWQALEMIHAQVVLAVNELQGKEPPKPCTRRLQH
ncbi:putative MULE transposase domain-containing protein [Ilyonectria robusta]